MGGRPKWHGLRLEAKRDEAILPEGFSERAQDQSANRVARTANRTFA